jgi:hypothetical protein
MSIEYKERGNKWGVYERKYAWDKQKKRSVYCSSKYLGMADEKGGKYYKRSEKPLLDIEDITYELLIEKLFSHNKKIQPIYSQMETIEKHLMKSSTMLFSNMHMPITEMIKQISNIESTNIYDVLVSIGKKVKLFDFNDLIWITLSKSTYSIFSLEVGTKISFPTRGSVQDIVDEVFSTEPKKYYIDVLVLFNIKNTEICIIPLLASMDRMKINKTLIPTHFIENNADIEGIRIKSNQKYIYSISDDIDFDDKEFIKAKAKEIGLRDYDGYHSTSFDDNQIQIILDTLKTYKLQLNQIYSIFKTLISLKVFDIEQIDFYRGVYFLYSVSLYIQKHLPLI